MSRLDHGKKTPAGMGHSPSVHNELQSAILQRFVPRFGRGARVVYVGDTAHRNRSPVLDAAALEDLHIRITTHGELPDMVLHLPGKGWLILVETATSHGPVSPKRKLELESVLVDCPLTRIYVSAFRSMAEFSDHIADIAWETGVWIADSPDHMIHYNGGKILGPAVTDRASGRVQDEPRVRLKGTSLRPSGLNDAAGPIDITTLSRQLDLEPGMLAKALGVSRETVRRYFERPMRPIRTRDARQRERFAKLNTVFSLLLASTHNKRRPHAIREWFHSPNKSLEMRRPVDLVYSGDFDTLIKRLTDALDAAQGG
jgi:uncharacterized protein (DUF2384 family)